MEQSALYSAYSFGYWIAHKISGIEVVVRTGKLSNKKPCFLRKHGAKLQKVSESAKKIAEKFVSKEKIYYPNLRFRASGFIFVSQISLM